MYSVQSGEIQANKLYFVEGTKYLVYDGITYGNGEYFRGIIGVTEFVYIGEGTELIIETTEIFAGGIIYEQNYADKKFTYEETGIRGMAICFNQTEAEKIVQETTELKGMSITLLDYPFYTYFVNETRFSFNPD